MKINLYGPNLQNQSKGQFHAHATGCAHCGRPEYRGAPMHQMEATSCKAVVEEVYGDCINEAEDPAQELANCAGDVYFAPCVKLPWEVAA